MTIVHARIFGRDGNFRFWESKDPYEVNPTPSYESDKFFTTKKEAEKALARFLKSKKEDWGKIDVRWSK